MDHSEAPKGKVIEEEVHEEEMVDYEASLKHLGTKINVITFFADYDIIGNDDIVMAQFDFGPKEVVFTKSKESVNHLKPLYMCSHIDRMLISRMLIDGGAAVNVIFVIPKTGQARC